MAFSLLMPLYLANRFSDNKSVISSILSNPSANFLYNKWFYLKSDESSIKLFAMVIIKHTLLLPKKRPLKSNIKVIFALTL